MAGASASVRDVERALRSVGTLNMTSCLVGREHSLNQL